MFESIKNFAASLDAKSLTVGAVLGAVTLGAVAVVYSRFSEEDEAAPTPAAKAAPEADVEVVEPEVAGQPEVEPKDGAAA